MKLTLLPIRSGFAIFWRIPIGIFRVFNLFCVESILINLKFLMALYLPENYLVALEH